MVLRGRFFHLNLKKLSNEHSKYSLGESGVELNTSNGVKYSEDNILESAMFVNTEGSYNINSVDTLKFCFEDNSVN